MKTVIIIGSSNPAGDTVSTAQELVSYHNADIINLNDYQFSYYDYEHKNRDDEFIPLMRDIIEKYELLIFATPVYWYSMSGIMKVFFDRITDLITIEKELGRKLRGKSMAALSTSNGNNLDEVFWLPFRETAEYLGMNYLGDVHTYEGKSVTKEVKSLALQIKNHNSTTAR